MFCLAGRRLALSPIGGRQAGAAAGSTTSAPCDRNQPHAVSGVSDCANGDSCLRFRRALKCKVSDSAYGRKRSSACFNRTANGARCPLRSAERVAGTLLLEVAVDQFVRKRPLPNTGSLREDLRTCAQRIATSLKSRERAAIFNVLVANGARTGVRHRGLPPWNPGSDTSN